MSVVASYATSWENPELWRALEPKLVARLEELAGHTAAGKYADFGAYQRAVGEIQGVRWVLEEAKAMVKQEEEAE